MPSTIGEAVKAGSLKFEVEIGNYKRYSQILKLTRDTYFKGINFLGDTVLETIRSLGGILPESFYKTTGW